MQRYDQDMPLDQVMYGQYIRYEHLNTLVGLEFEGSSAEHVNVFIDLYEALLPLYRHLNTSHAIELISSCILNMVSHYRKYFWTRHRVTTQIIFVYSNMTSINISRYCPEYNSKYRDRVLSNTEIGDKVDRALEFVKMLVPYMPDVYFKFGTVEPAVIIKNLITTIPLFQQFPNVVISSSEYMYCLPANCEDTVVFRRKYNAKKKATIAYSYNFVNAINAFAHETRKIVIDHPVYPKLISTIMVLSGIPKKNVISSKDIVTSVNLLSDMPKEMIGNIEATYRFLSEKCKAKNQRLLSFETFYNRFMAIDIDTQLAIYQHTPEATENAFLTQLEDPDAMKYINGRYFTHYPINFEGV